MFSELEALLGSSPRVWGTHLVLAPGFGFARLIPTGVGNTSPAGSHSTLAGAHPHGCGEHRQCNVCALTCRGSSPRVWGTH